MASCFLRDSFLLLFLHKFGKFIKRKGKDCYEFSIKSRYSTKLGYNSKSSYKKDSILQFQMINAKKDLISLSRYSFSFISIDECCSEIVAFAV